MDVKRIPWPQFLIGAVVAVLPALLGYCQSSKEAEVASREADAGYRALVQSVKNLESVVASQQTVLQLLVHRDVPTAAAGSAAASAGVDPPIAAPDTPSFPELPANTSAALRQQSAL